MGDCQVEFFDAFCIILGIYKYITMVLLLLTLYYFLYTLLSLLNVNQFYNYYYCYIGEVFIG